MMGGSVLPPSHMAASVNAWAGPLTPVALRLVSGNTYALVDALGRTVTPPTTPTIRIDGGQEHGLALSETTRTNAVPHDCPTRSQLSHVAGDSPADAAMTGAVLTRTDWQGTVTLSSAARTNLVRYSEEINNAGWLKLNSGTASAPVVTPNAATAPDGTTTADLVVFDLNGAVDSYYSVIRSPFVDYVIGPSITSFWAKTADGSTKTLRFVPPSGYGPSLITVTGEWRRFIQPWTQRGAGSDRFNLQLLGNAGTSDSASIYLWGAQYETGNAVTTYIPTTSDPVTVTDYVLGAFAPDGSLPVTLAQPADALSWDNAPTGCSLVKTDDTHYTLTQPAVSDGNLIGYPALTFSGDLTLGRSAWQDATITSGQTYSFSAIVEVEGEPTYGPDGLFRVVLSGDNPSIGTATWTAIPGQTNRYRLDVTGLSVASSTGRVGIYRAPGQADARAFTISRWTLCDHLGRLIAGSTSEADFVRDGSAVTLTRAIADGVVEAVWA